MDVHICLNVCVSKVSITSSPRKKIMNMKKKLHMPEHLRCSSGEHFITHSEAFEWWLQTHMHFVLTLRRRNNEIISAQTFNPCEFLRKCRRNNNYNCILFFLLYLHICVWILCILCANMMYYIIIIINTFTEF